MWMKVFECIIECMDVSVNRIGDYCITNKLFIIF